MFDLGIKPECFNPQVYFTFRGRYEENHVTEVHSHDFVTVIYVMSEVAPIPSTAFSYRVRKETCSFSTQVCPTAKNVGAGEEIMELHVGLGNA